MSEPKDRTNDLLNLTSDEALDFLFPKEVADGLKTVAKPEKEPLNLDDANDDDCVPDSMTQ